MLLWMTTFRNVKKEKQKENHDQQRRTSISGIVDRKETNWNECVWIFKPNKFLFDRCSHPSAMCFLAPGKMAIFAILLVHKHPSPQQQQNCIHTDKYRMIKL